MSETLVVINTFEDLMRADEAQVQLLNAGIYSLLLSSDPEPPALPVEHRDSFVLAVHTRDADMASAVLTPVMEPESS